jgi:hypothetical protein
MFVLLTASSGVVFEKSLVSQEFPFVLWKPNFHTSVYKILSLLRIISKVSPVHAILSWSANLLFFFRFRHTIQEVGWGGHRLD